MPVFAILKRKCQHRIVIRICLLVLVFIWAQLIRLVLKVNTVFFNKLKREKGNTIAIEFTSTLRSVTISGLDSLCFEIPYNYETIIMKQDEKEAADVKAAMNA